MDSKFLTGRLRYCLKMVSTMRVTLKTTTEIALAFTIITTETSTMESGRMISVLAVDAFLQLEVEAKLVLCLLMTRPTVLLNLKTKMGTYSRPKTTKQRKLRKERKTLRYRTLLVFF